MVSRRRSRYPTTGSSTSPSDRPETLVTLAAALFQASGANSHPIWRGRREFVEFIGTWTCQFEDYSIQLEPLIDAGDDRVVAIYRQHATGMGAASLSIGTGAWSSSCGMATRLERRNNTVAHLRATG